MDSTHSDQSTHNSAHQVVDNQPTVSQPNKEESDSLALRQQGPQPRPIQSNGPRPSSPGLPGRQGRGPHQGRGPRQHGNGNSNTGRHNRKGKKKSGSINNSIPSQSSTIPNPDTMTILKNMEELSSTSMNSTSQLSSKIESLIDVLTATISQPSSPVPPQTSIHIPSAKESDGSNSLTLHTAKEQQHEDTPDSYHAMDITSEDLVSHRTAILNYFGSFPFELSTHYIEDFLLDRYETVNNIFTEKTTSLHDKSLIIQLNRLGRLDDYEELENDLIIYSPQKRFERVFKRSPQLFQEIPQKYIASYLRMTPETLSRILKNLD